MSRLIYFMSGLPAGVYVHLCVPGACKGQKRELDPRELELQESITDMNMSHI